MTDWTDPETFRAALDRAGTREKGTYFESFVEGETIEHEPGLRLTRHAAERWTSQTLNHDPAYWRPDAARDRGFDEPPIHPDYLLAATMGPSVEALSEKGGYFLGRDDVTFPRDAVYAGTELRVESTVLATRPSGSRPNYGIVTWETRGVDVASGDLLCSYERTNMVPRRDPVEAGAEAREGTSSADRDDRSEDDAPDVPETLLAPDGEYFEAFAEAMDAAADRPDAAVAYRHDRGRTMDAVTVTELPLATLNTARQHHDAASMRDSPSGEIVAYGDVTRSTALGHARSDEATCREVSATAERFHDFVTIGDTIYGFTRVLAADGDPGPPHVGEVTFEHVAFDQDRRPVYSGRRTAQIERRDGR
ncbi:hypothetical protein GCM10028857_16610 [Salinarchaeum chitinilyticum]